MTPISIADAAGRLGCAERTIYRRFDDGTLTRHYTPDGVRVDADELDRPSPVETHWTELCAAVQEATGPDIAPWAPVFERLSDLRGALIKAGHVTRSAAWP